MENNTNQIFKDYTLKIKNKLNIDNHDKLLLSEDINNLIIFFNWCFLKKNNFFIHDFNKRNIFLVCTSYNQIKTNILSKEIFNEISDIFENIPENNLKTIKFILYQYTNKYDDLSKETSNTDLCQKISKDSMKNCIAYI